jgi:cation diffusion facilitator family transporter
MQEEILSENKTRRKVTLTGFAVNAVLTVFKLIAGIIGRSGAMLADGVHSLSDFLTDIVVLVGIRYTAQPADECHNYGHNKYETMATAVIAIFLIVVGFEILKGGVEKIITVIRGGTLESPGFIALYAAGISIIMKEALYQYTMHFSRKLKSQIVKANAWHHRSDAFSSIGTLIGISGAIFLGSKWAVLDPIASVIVSVFIFKVAYRILKPAAEELMEKALPAEQTKAITDIIELMPDIKGYHHLRTRSLGKKSVVETHIFVDRDMSVKDSHDIASELEKKIRETVNKDMFITVHIEPYDPEYRKNNN